MKVLGELKVLCGLADEGLLALPKDFMRARALNSPAKAMQMAKTIKDRDKMYRRCTAVKNVHGADSDIYLAFVQGAKIAGYASSVV